VKYLRHFFVLELEPNPWILLTRGDYAVIWD